MNGVDMRTEDDRLSTPVTVLTGHFIDQAALASILNTLYDLGFPLLKVELIGTSPW